MLLVVLGYNEYREDAIGMAESIGLRPSGMLREFSLGDMMLYLERCLEMQDAEGVSMRDRAAIPDEDELVQKTTPNTISIYPIDLDDAERQIRKAFQYMPYYISVQMGGGLTVDDLNELERCYEASFSSAVGDTGEEEVWWLPYAYWYKTDFHMNAYRLSESALRLKFEYGDAAMLILDLDDAFTPFKDDTITRLADKLYQENIAQYKGQYDEVVIRKIEELISKNASYDHEVFRGETEREAAYHISGFFENGKFVCMGYAQLFSYLCLRADIEAITVVGSSKTPETATRGEGDHIWNKVKVGGKWYNEDICWGDNDRDCDERFSLRSDASFNAWRHYPAEHFNGVYAAREDYRPSLMTRGFDDVSAGAYYYDAIRWSVEQGIAAGTSAKSFSPEAACTRGQVVTFLWRAAGSPEPVNSRSPFNDVPDGAYYHDAVCWAVEQGITAGTSAATFSPDAACTRGQVVTFLWRAAGSPEPVNSRSPFNDVPDGAYYHDAAAWAAERGIANGTSTGVFSPDSVCTRGQVVTFLHRSYTA